MSTLTFASLTMPGGALGGLNPLPPLDRCMPHRFQDNYGRERVPREFRIAVLENDVLRATFLPELGGRLWSLFDKRCGEELLYVNPVFQPVNIAIRGAWFSGGVEWNIGLRGHTAYTCSPLFAARLTDGAGSPVLRLYEWDRNRLTPYQLDFFMPDGAEFLYARVRIVNPNPGEVPMYWWSNAAVPERPDGRVIVPADSAYRYAYDGNLTESPIPYVDGKDLSHPHEFNGSGDSFYHMSEGRRPWIAAVDRQGRGFVQTSTSLLKGRKLFVWGMRAGGRRWQEFLSVRGAPYIELQAGLTATQWEYATMPGCTQWAWLEAYGPIAAEPDVVHGRDWQAAYEAVGAELDAALPQQDLEKLFQQTASLAERAPEEIVQHGSGWGALERRRRELAGENAMITDCAAPFDDVSIGPDQEPWLALLEEGALPECDPAEAPGAWMIQADWQKLLAAAVESGASDHWLARLHLGNMAYCTEDWDGAQSAWERSLELAPSAWACRNLAVLARRRKRPNDSAELMLAACKLAPALVPLAAECCDALLHADRPAEVLALVARLPEQFRSNGRIRLLEAWAAMETHDFDRALAFLNGKAVVADMREGEHSLSALWYKTHENRIAAQESIPVDDALRERVREEFPVPQYIDFRQKPPGLPRRRKTRAR